MQNWLGIVHGADYVFVHLFLGMLIFSSFILPAGGSEARRLPLRWPRKISILMALLSVSSVFYLILSLADMGESWAPLDLWNAMTQTSFGHLWCGRVVILLVGLIVSLSAHSKTSTLKNSTLITIGLAVILISALTGHAGSVESGRIFRILVDWFHSVAIATWVGGLWCLALWLKARLRQPTFGRGITFRVVERFSRFAQVSTGVIAVSGLAMAYWSGVKLIHPWETVYGKLVLAKFVLFLAALAAAAINQFRHLRRYREENDLGFSASIYREVGIELILVLLIFGIAGFLTRTALPSM